MRTTITILASAVLTAAAATAHATGLAVPALGDNGPPVALAALQSLTVDARLAESGVELTEVRKYALSKYAGTTVSATFHYSVLGTGATPPTVTVAGQPVTGVVLEGDEADGVRRRLTLDLGDPTSLRGLGSALYVGDPTAVAVPAGGLIEVKVTSTAPLSTLGTMRGLVMPIDWARPVVSTVDVKVSARSAAPLRALYSPFHALDVVRDGVTAVHGTYAGKSVCTDLDLTVLFSAGEGLVQLDLLPFRYGEGPLEGGTFLALLTPDPTPVVVTNVLPRDLALVVDTSGSMAGVKITQAKEALRGVLSGLRPVDAFSLTSFATTVTTFQSGAMLKATPENVAAAIAFVDGLTATGGTNISEALRTGLGSLSAESGHPRYVVFLTDGQPTAGVLGIDALTADVRTQNVSGARLFSFGIGNDVNTLLLDRLARESAGDVIYIRPDQSVAEAVKAFFLQISDPVLANPRLDLTAFGVSDLFPETLPDLFTGRTVTLLGRYAVRGRSSIVLSGTRNGNPWSATYDVTLPEYALDSGFVPRIWALRQVGRLLAKIKEGDKDPGLVTEVVRLASRFGVTTAYTTFTADAQGNVALKYGAVPVAQTGAAAVDASSSLRDYNMSGTVPATGVPSSPVGVAVVRYVSDRTLPPLDGYLTDTKLSPETAAFVDLTFGSDRYFAFAKEEAPYGAAGLLATSANVRLELLGRAVRITNPKALPAGATELPSESPDLPAPSWRPTAAPGTAVIPVQAHPAPAPVADPPAAIPDPGLGGGGEASLPLASRTGCECGVESGAMGAGGPGALLLLASLFLTARRRRPRPPRA